MEDVAASLSVLAVLVCVCELVRSVGGRCGEFAAEVVATIQLCACAHELKLLSGREPAVALALTYAISVTHALTFRGAHANPTATLERWWGGEQRGSRALARCACQFAAAACAGPAMQCAWTLGMSDLHARHALAGFECASSIKDLAPLGGAVAELACAFAVHAVSSLTHGLSQRARVHAVAAAITLVVYTGGSITGAVFNPALAFTTEFPCSGTTFAKNSLVYGVGPVLGMAFSRLLFKNVIPVFIANITTRVDQKKEAAKKLN